MKTKLLITSFVLMSLAWSENNLATNIDLQSGLIAYYPFNGNANDESGNGHDGIVDGATLTTDRFNNSNKAYYFDGQGNSIAVNDFNLPSDSITVSCWVKVLNPFGIQNFISKHNSSDDVEILIRSIDTKYVIEWTIGDKYFRLVDDNGLSPLDLDQPRFDFLTLVYNGEKVVFYVNNQIVATKDISGKIANNILPMVFGKYAPGTQEYLKGTLDDVRIYNRALNHQEIEALYSEENNPHPLPTLTTHTAFSVTPTSATSGGNIISEGNSVVFARGICWSTSPHPDTTNNITVDGSGADSFVSNLTGLTPSTTYYIRAYAINSSGVGYGNEISFTTKSGLEYGSVTDVEGNIYKTIKIGDQTWMAENLKTTRYYDSIPISLVEDNTSWASLSTPAYCWYFNDFETFGKTYGALYNWHTVNTGKLCPANWHVPTHNEWFTLGFYLGGLNIAGGKLKETGLEHWKSPNTGATNESGFEGLPGGNRAYYDGHFMSLHNMGGFWTSTENTSTGAYGWGMSFDWSKLTYGSNDDKKNGISVRCIKDSEDTTEPVDLQEGLIAYYPFNGNANDASGHGHSVNINGAFLTTDRFNEKNSAFLFDGENDNLITEDAFFNIGWDEYSVSCWVYSTSWSNPGSNASNQSIINTIPHNGFELCFNWGGTNKYGVFLNSDPSQSTWDILHNGTSKTGTSINRWNHLVIVKKNNQYSLYINGSPDTIFTSSVSQLDSMCKMVLGSIDPSVENEYFKGKLDDYYIYNRALNIAEIKTLYGDYLHETPLVITIAADSVSNTGAIVNGIILYDGDEPIVEKGICWSLHQNPSISDNKTISISESDSFACNITDLNPNTIYYARAYALNKDAIGYGEEIKFTTWPDLDFGSVTDIDGNTYKTIHIGQFNWMAENLKVTRFNDGSPISNVTDNLEWGSMKYPAYCWYENDEDTYREKYGALYNYHVVMDERNICPVGWHISKSSEWATLPCTNSVPYPDELGHYHDCVNLKAMGYWGGNITNSTGFTAIPGGLRQGRYYPDEPSGYYKGSRFLAFYWTSSGNQIHLISDSQINIYHELNIFTSLYDGYSIRCVEDRPLIVIPDLSAHKNGKFGVPVSVDRLSVGEVVSYQFDFYFDSGRMIYQGNSIDNTLSKYGEIQVNQTEGRLSVAWAGQTPLADSGTLVRLQFKAIESGTVTPLISNFLLNTDTVNYITNGIIYISPAYGDVDGNEAVQAFDAALALQYSVGLDPISEIDSLPWDAWRIESANVDGQDNISAFDASLILQHTVGLIQTFPVENYLKSTNDILADIYVNFENGNMVFRSTGDLKGLNIQIEGNPQLFGTPQLTYANAIIASNYSSSGLSVGLALANTPPEGEIILKIPLIAVPEESISMNLLINNHERQMKLDRLTGLHEVSKKLVEIYPNPANTILYFNNITGDASVNIFDMQGRLVISRNIVGNQLDIGKLPKGVYTIHLTDRSYTIIRKLVKK